jgi:hypothetical protein
MKSWVLLITHLGALVLGFGLGIYFLPILTAPPAPTYNELAMAKNSPRFTGIFRRDLKDSDALHWGQGQVFIGADTIALQGELSPGPDYKLYLSPVFVETEPDFKRLKSLMVQVTDIKTFKNFVVSLPASIDPSQYKAIVIWCESFNEFITAAPYQEC